MGPWRPTVQGLSKLLQKCSVMKPSQTSMLDSNTTDIRNDLEINFDHRIPWEPTFSKQIWFKEIGTNFKRPCVLWDSILQVPSICFLSLLCSIEEFINRNVLYDFYSSFCKSTTKSSFFKKNQDTIKISIWVSKCTWVIPYMWWDYNRRY